MRRGILGVLAGALFGLIVFSAIGGYLLAPSAQSQGQHQQAVRGEPGTGHHRNQPEQSAVDRAGLPGPIERAISNPQPDEGTEREKRDLAAQEASATFAFWMVFMAGLQTVVAGVGIYYIRKTILQSQKHAHIELRPYVRFRNTHLTKAGKGKWKLRGFIVNHGQTPAVLRFHNSVHFRRYPVERDPPLPPYDDLETYGVEMYLGPHDERPISSGPFKIDAAWEALMRQSKASIIVRGVLDYTTHGGEYVKVERDMMTLGKAFEDVDSFVGLERHHYEDYAEAKDQGGEEA